MEIKRTILETPRERILSRTKAYSHPLRCIDSFFDNVPISESIKIKNELICEDRYFAGVIKDRQRGYERSLHSTCENLGLNEKGIEEIKNVKNINQFYVGAQKLGRRVSYRVYAGSYDDTRSSGDGIAIEWREKNRYKSRKYWGHRYTSVEDLSRDSLSILNENKELNEKVLDFLIGASRGRDLLSLSNCVKSAGGERQSIDMSLDFAGSDIIKCKSQLSELFKYFGHEYHSYYKFFLPSPGRSLVTRFQWGIDSDSEEFVNVYHMQRNV